MEQYSGTAKQQEMTLDRKMVFRGQWTQETLTQLLHYSATTSKIQTEQKFSAKNVVLTLMMKPPEVSSSH